MEEIFGGLLEFALEFAPKPVRVGCGVLGFIVVVALLTIWLWGPKVI